MSGSDVFLLSPAYCGGRRATWLMRPGSKLPLAQRLAAGSLSLGDAFAFMSGLYFRGKLTYAQRFAATTGEVHVITPTRGLLPPQLPVTIEMLREFATVDVSADDERYRAPLDRDVRRLAGGLGREGRVILLGSIATGKYVDALSAVLGPALCYPTDFVGRGDMSRGGLLLRAAAAGDELPYRPLLPGAVRTGARPPRLAPIARPRA